MPGQIVTVLRRIRSLSVVVVVATVSLLRWLQFDPIEHSPRRKEADIGSRIRNLVQLDLFERLERKTYDMRVREALRFSPTVATNLGFVFIDEESIRNVSQGIVGDTRLGYRFGLYWPRQVYGRAIRELADQGAKTVAFAVMLGDLRWDHFPVRMDDGSNMESDDYFGLEMRRRTNVILGITEGLDLPSVFRTNALALGDIGTDKDAPEGILRRARAFRTYRNWHPAFQQLQAAPDFAVNLHETRLEPGQIVLLRPAALGDLRIPLDPNGNFEVSSLIGDNLPEGMARKAKPYHDERIWHMGIVLAAQDLGLDLNKAEVDLEHHRITLRGASGVERVIPTDDDGFFYVDWCMLPESPALMKESIGYLLKQNSMRLKDPSIEITNRWRGKLAVLGSSTAGIDLTDRGATPLRENTLLVSKIWNIASSIITGRFVRRSPLSVDLALIFLLCILAAALTSESRTLLTSGLMMLLVAAYVACGVALYVKTRYYIPLVLPSIGAFAMPLAYRLMKRPDPRVLAKRFFIHAGFRRVQSLPNNLLLLLPKEGQVAGLVFFWKENCRDFPDALVDMVRTHGKTFAGSLRLYIIYARQAPPTQVIHRWRTQLGCEIIPVLAAMLERALGTGDHDRQLKELEEPYLVRVDPYAEFKPISDPTWFYGRGDLLDRLPAAIAQGQHAGIFGLRKVGKTSLANQLRQRFVATPSVFLDCQGLTAKAANYFDAIYRGLHAELSAQKVRRLPKVRKIRDGEDFSLSLIALFECWQRTGQHEPFLLILDEIDKFFPNPEARDREAILTEYVRLFRVLRSLAQSRQCLVVMVIAYRPDVSRQNLLTSATGENPMFNSFQEHYLGFLEPTDSAALVREIGLWKMIIWEEAAARAVFRYCGGHPLITRYFASHTCRRGALKKIDEARVHEAAIELQKNFRKNDIGNYYKEGIWELLMDDERLVLEMLVKNQGCAENTIPLELEEGLSNVERFGLVENRDGLLFVTAELFRAWVQRRISS